MGISHIHSRKCTTISHYLSIELSLTDLSDRLCVLKKDLSLFRAVLKCLQSQDFLSLQSHCSIVPLIGDEPLSFVGAFRRVWELMSAGLFLPGSVGVPDPCEVSVLIMPMGVAAESKRACVCVCVCVCVFQL